MFRNFYKTVRAIIVIIVALILLVPAILYVGVTLPGVQRRLAGVTAKELSQLLGADVEVGALSVSPFNRVLLRDVNVLTDNRTDTVMRVHRLGAGINLYELAINRRLLINYVEVIGLDMTVSRDTVGAPLNIDPIIAKLKGNGSPGGGRIDLAVNTLILRNSSIRYDVRLAPIPEPGHFSPHHLMVSDLSADISAPSVGGDKNIIDIKRFKAREQSGLQLTNLAGRVELTPQSLSWNGVVLEMPRSKIVLNDLSLSADTLTNPLQLLTNSPLAHAGISGKSFITPADLSPLVPLLGNFAEPLDLSLTLDGTIAELSTIDLSLNSPDELINIELQGDLSQPLSTSERSLTDGKLYLHGDIPALASRLELPEATTRHLEHLGSVTVATTIAADPCKGSASSRIITEAGEISLDATATHLDTPTPHFDVVASLDDISLKELSGNPGLDGLSAEITAEGQFTGRRPSGKTHIDITRLDWHGHPFGDIVVSAELHGDDFIANIDSEDPAARLALDATGKIGSKGNTLSLHARCERLDLGDVSANDKLEEHILSLGSEALLEWTNIDDIEGYVTVNDISYDRPGVKAVELDKLSLRMTTDDATGVRVATLQSPIVRGEVRGNIYPSTITSQCQDILYGIMPALASEPVNSTENGDLNNCFVYDFTVLDTEQWADDLGFKLSNLGHSSLEGRFDYSTRTATMKLDAPYLRQGNKLIEKTELELSADGRGKTPVATLDFTTTYPTKHGPLKLSIESSAMNDSILSGITWDIDRVARYDGRLAFGTTLNRSSGGPLGARVDIRPGELTFNDSTWIVNPASIDYNGDIINVEGINAYRAGQFVKIDGRVSANPLDVLKVDLLGIDLGYIFESLSIDNVMLGGDATGRFYAEGLLSPEPRIETPGLHVKQISYNKVPLGDAVVKSHWDGENRAVTLDAVIDQENGSKTLIDGAIFPLNDSLDIVFDTHDVNIAFMRHYMGAFASEVSGEASGKVRLWGNFKYIDIEGDVKAQDLKMKIAFTNTTYATSDSVRLRLGEITLKNVTLTDIYGNTARLDGHVWHSYFKEPSFDFTINDASNLLVYDETRRQNPDWYGRIFANGSAHIDGHPGVVNVGVNMATAAGSTFTFVLNDMEEASDYSFITFRDRDVLALGEQEALVDDVPSTVKRLRQLLAQGPDEGSSAYNIDLMIDINPQAQINLIMDPRAGDNIRSRGAGSMRMTYGSADNELHMWGTYTLDRGNYNFSLQDIILRDFTIKPGSKISFSGDPFSAILDINAAYSLTANLSELDESFTQDKDLNRTTVPVNAILKVTGALQQPEIGFDLEFPTLTQDTYRKVRSIVSTDEMMNRQIIYLLALSRFYTPDYMDSATRGNELVSVASSTISSQLGNILGSLSDNWNIAPTFRSDRGDFSDLEVDVALSSSLLNNRLLFNGNFGYRDKTLNTTQFVGDFDIEYLLNRPGTLRLKAYNRYNDMNYYVRTAETTQGVGITFRRNFDTIGDFLGLTRHK